MFALSLFSKEISINFINTAKVNSFVVFYSCTNNNGDGNELSPDIPQSRLGKGMYGITPKELKKYREDIKNKPEKYTVSEYKDKKYYETKKELQFLDLFKKYSHKRLFGEFEWVSGYLQDVVKDVEALRYHVRQAYFDTVELRSSVGGSFINIDIEVERFKEANKVHKVELSCIKEDLEQRIFKEVRSQLIEKYDILAKADMDIYFYFFESGALEALKALAEDRFIAGIPDNELKRMGISKDEAFEYEKNLMWFKVRKLLPKRKRKTYSPLYDLKNVEELLGNTRDFFMRLSRLGYFKAGRDIARASKNKSGNSIKRPVYNTEHSDTIDRTDEYCMAYINNITSTLAPAESLTKEERCSKYMCSRKDYSEKSMKFLRNLIDKIKEDLAREIKYRIDPAFRLKNRAYHNDRDTWEKRLEAFHRRELNMINMTTMSLASEFNLVHQPYSMDLTDSSRSPFVKRTGDFYNYGFTWLWPNNTLRIATVLSFNSYNDEQEGFDVGYQEILRNIGLAPESAVYSDLPKEVCDFLIRLNKYFWALQGLQSYKLKFCENLRSGFNYNTKYKYDTGEENPGWERKSFVRNSEYRK